MDIKTNQITEFANYLKFVRRASQHTIKAYTDDLQHFLNFADDQPLSRDLIRQWLVGFAEKGYDARSINRKMYSIKCFTRHCMKLGILAENPAKHLKQRKIKSRLQNGVPEAELKKTDVVISGKGLHSKTRKRDRIVVQLLYQTGMRVAEAASLEIKNIDFAQSQLKVTGKGGNQRLIPLSPVMCGELKRFIRKRQSGYLFRALKGGMISTRSLYDSVSRQLQLTNSPAKNPHALRHSFATHLMNNGANLIAIQNLMGHTSLVATMPYLHVNIDRLKNVHSNAHPKGNI